MRTFKAGDRVVFDDRTLGISNNSAEVLTTDRDFVLLMADGYTDSDKRRVQVLACDVRHAAPTTAELVKVMKEMAFMLETVAHLTGREAMILPTTDQARELIARAEGAH